MHQKITFRRGLPANFESKHLPLFQDALEGSFDREHAVMVKNSMILQDTVFAPGEFKFYSRHTHRSNLGFPQFSKRVANSMVKSWKRIPQGIWVIDEWSANYFHWITDSLPRVWEGIQWKPDAPVILPDSYRQIPYVEDSLKLAGVEVLFFKSSQNLWIDQLIVTARTATFPNFDIPLTLKSRNIFRLNSDKLPFRKVYLSRKRASKRKILNELDLELMLIKRDFELLSGDDLSLSDQIRLMSETKLLVGLHGAALTNMLFMPDGSKVVEFRNESDVNNHCYFNLASTLDIPYYYTVNPSTNPDTVIADFTIDLVKLGAVLDEIG